MLLGCLCLTVTKSLERTTASRHAFIITTHPIRGVELVHKQNQGTEET